MRFVDFFAGIGGFHLGLSRTGHEFVAACEIADFPRRVYAYHFEEPRFDDVTAIEPRDISQAELWCGGFPCQDASSAGAGLGLLGGKRSGLVFRLLGLAAVARPKWILLENVPGLLFRGRGFGRLLGVLARLGYGFSWRTLDAQFFSVAQRRRRVYLLACLGAPAERVGALLLEPPSLCGNSPPSREAGTRPARTIAASLGGSGAEGSRDELIHAPSVARPLLSHAGRVDWETESFVAGFNAYTSGGTESAYTPDGSTPVRGGNPPAVVIPFSKAQVTSPHNRSRCLPGCPQATLASSGEPEHVAGAGWVRRLTPLECERLQGFPDGWTDLPGASDGKRYTALGNSVAVPVIEWIGERLRWAEETGWC